MIKHNCNLFQIEHLYNNDKISIYDPDINKIKHINLNLPTWFEHTDGIIYVPFVKKIFLFFHYHQATFVDINHTTDRIKIESIESIKVGDKIDYKRNNNWVQRIVKSINYETNEIIVSWMWSDIAVSLDKLYIYQYLAQPYKAKMPFEHGCFQCILVFDVIVFFFCYKSKDIWCLNICNDEWIKCDVKFPTFYGDFKQHCKISKTEDNMVHFMYLSSNEEYYENYHLKVSLYDIIPMKLKLFEKGIYYVLIHGYINTINGVIIPQDVVFLI
eukprot:467896_1